MKHRGRVTINLFILFFTAFLCLWLCLPAHAQPYMASDAMAAKEGLSATGSTDPLDEWWWRNPLPSGNQYSAIAYGNGTFVAVGSGRVLTSSDGITWSEHGSVLKNVEFRGVAYGNGVFVAVGGKVNFRTGIDTPMIYISQDAVNWNQTSVPITLGGLNSVAFGNGKFVAVGWGRSIITSRDGSSWTAVRASQNLTQILNEGLFGVVYGDGLFVAAGMGAVGGSILTSSDGMAWNERANPDTGRLFSVAYGNGTYVAAGDGPSFLTSSDGITWTVREQPAVITDRVTSITWGNNVFVAAQFGGTLVTSPDGIVWTKQTLPVTSARFTSTAFGNGAFAAIGSTTSRPLILTSPDGAVWTDRGSSITGSRFGLVEYINGMFVAKGDGVFTSHDGVQWTESTSLEEIAFQAITHADGVFVAVGYSGDYHACTPFIYTSSDGNIWTERSLPVTDGALVDVTYGNGTFVAVGNYWKGQPNGGYVTVSTILTSPDGSVWTQGRLPDDVTNAGLSAIAYGNGTFAGAGYRSYNTPALFTSSDGIKWTARNTPAKDVSFVKIVYGNNIFAAVANDFGGPGPTVLGGGVILTSSDGVKWTKRYAPGDGSLLYSMAYGNGIFMTVGQGVALASSNGITWTKRTVPATGILYSVAYGNKTFVAVSDAGAIIQSSPLGNVISVVKEGGGQGKVVSSPGGINCGTSCSATFNENKVITLTATSSAGSVFTGWAGDCTGSGACTVTMNKDIAVTATFIASPALSVSPVYLNFGKVKSGGVSPSKAVTVRNTGASGSILTVQAPAITGANSAEFTANSSCVAPLAKGDSCTISVSFSPQSDGKSMSAVLNIPSDAPTRGTALVKLTGGSGPPKISVTPLSITFPATSTGPTPVPSRTVTLRNTGISDLIITSTVTRDGTDPSFGASNDCSTLKTHETCKITVTFNPSTAGKKTGWIDIVSNTLEQVSIQLTGIAK